MSKWRSTVRATTSLVVARNRVKPRCDALRQEVAQGEDMDTEIIAYILFTAGSILNSAYFFFGFWCFSSSSTVVELVSTGYSGAKLTTIYPKPRLNGLLVCRR